LRSRRHLFPLLSYWKSLFTVIGRKKKKKEQHCQTTLNLSRTPMLCICFAYLRNGLQHAPPIATSSPCTTVHTTFARSPPTLRVSLRPWVWWAEVVRPGLDGVFSIRRISFRVRVRVRVFGELKFGEMKRQTRSVTRWITCRHKKMSAIARTMVSSEVVVSWYLETAISVQSPQGDLLFRGSTLKQKPWT